MARLRSWIDRVCCYEGRTFGIWIAVFVVHINLDKGYDYRPGLIGGAVKANTICS